MSKQVGASEPKANNTTNKITKTTGKVGQP